MMEQTATHSPPLSGNSGGGRPLQSATSSPMAPPMSLNASFAFKNNPHIAAAAARGGSQQQRRRSAEGPSILDDYMTNYNAMASTMPSNAGGLNGSTANVSFVGMAAVASSVRAAASRDYRPLMAPTPTAGAGPSRAGSPNASAPGHAPLRQQQSSGNFGANRGPSQLGGGGRGPSLTSPAAAAAAAKEAAQRHQRAQRLQQEAAAAAQKRHEEATSESQLSLHLLLLLLDLIETFYGYTRQVTALTDGLWGLVADTQLKIAGADLAFSKERQYFLDTAERLIGLEVPQRFLQSCAAEQRSANVSAAAAADRLAPALFALTEVVMDMSVEGAKIVARAAAVGTDAAELARQTTEATTSGDGLLLSMRSLYSCGPTPISGGTNDGVLSSFGTNAGIGDVASGAAMRPIITTVTAATVSNEEEAFYVGGASSPRSGGRSQSVSSLRGGSGAAGAGSPRHSNHPHPPFYQQYNSQQRRNASLGGGYLSDGGESLRSCRSEHTNVGGGVARIDERSGSISVPSGTLPTPPTISSARRQAGSGTAAHHLNNGGSSGYALGGGADRNTPLSTGGEDAVTVVNNSTSTDKGGGGLEENSSASPVRPQRGGAAAIANPFPFLVPLTAPLTDEARTHLLLLVSSIHSELSCVAKGAAGMPPNLALLSPVLAREATRGQQQQQQIRFHGASQQQQQQQQQPTPAAVAAAAPSGASAANVGGTPLIGNNPTTSWPVSQTVASVDAGGVVTDSGAGRLRARSLPPPARPSGKHSKGSSPGGSAAPSESGATASGQATTPALFATPSVAYDSTTEQHPYPPPLTSANLSRLGREQQALAALTANAAPTITVSSASPLSPAPAAASAGRVASPQFLGVGPTAAGAAADDTDAFGGSGLVPPLQNVLSMTAAPRSPRSPISAGLTVSPCDGPIVAPEGATQQGPASSSAPSAAVAAKRKEWGAKNTSVNGNQQQPQANAKVAPPLFPNTPTVFVMGAAKASLVASSGGMGGGQLYPHGLNSGSYPYPSSQPGSPTAASLAPPPLARPSLAFPNPLSAQRHALLSDAVLEDARYADAINEGALLHHELAARLSYAHRSSPPPPTTALSAYFASSARPLATAAGGSARLNTSGHPQQQPSGAQLLLLGSGDTKNDSVTSTAKVAAQPQQQQSDATTVQTTAAGLVESYLRQRGAVAITSGATPMGTNGGRRAAAAWSAWSPHHQQQRQGSVASGRGDSTDEASGGGASFPNIHHANNNSNIHNTMSAMLTSARSYGGWGGGGATAAGADDVFSSAAAAASRRSSSPLHIIQQQQHNATPTLRLPSAAAEATASAAINSDRTFASLVAAYASHMAERSATLALVPKDLALPLLGSGNGGLLLATANGASSGGVAAGGIDTPLASSASAAAGGGGTLPFPLPLPTVAGPATTASNTVPIVAVPLSQANSLRSSAISGGGAATLSAGGLQQSLSTAPAAQTSSSCQSFSPPPNSPPPRSFAGAGGGGVVTGGSVTIPGLGDPSSNSTALLTAAATDSGALLPHSSSGANTNTTTTSGSMARLAGSLAGVAGLSVPFALSTSAAATTATATTAASAAAVDALLEQNSLLADQLAAALAIIARQEAGYLSAREEEQRMAIVASERDRRQALMGTAAVERSRLALLQLSAGTGTGNSSGGLGGVDSSRGGSAIAPETSSPTTTLTANTSLGLFQCVSGVSVGTTMVERANSVMNGFGGGISANASAAGFGGGGGGVPDSLSASDFGKAKSWSTHRPFLRKAWGGGDQKSAERERNNVSEGGGDVDGERIVAKARSWSTSRPFLRKTWSSREMDGVIEDAFENSGGGGGRQLPPGIVVTSTSAAHISDPMLRLTSAKHEQQQQSQQKHVSATAAAQQREQEQQQPQQQTSSRGPSPFPQSPAISGAEVGGVTSGSQLSAQHSALLIAPSGTTPSEGENSAALTGDASGVTHSSNANTFTFAAIPSSSSIVGGTPTLPLSVHPPIRRRRALSSTLSKEQQQSTPNKLSGFQPFPTMPTADEVDRLHYRPTLSGGSAESRAAAPLPLRHHRRRHSSRKGSLTVSLSRHSDANVGAETQKNGADMDMEEGFDSPIASAFMRSPQARSPAPSSRVSSFASSGADAADQLALEGMEDDNADNDEAFAFDDDRGSATAAGGAFAAWGGGGMGEVAASNEWDHFAGFENEGFAAVPFERYHSHSYSGGGVDNNHHHQNHQQHVHDDDGRDDDGGGADGEGEWDFYNYDDDDQQPNYHNNGGFGEEGEGEWDFYGDGADGFVLDHPEEGDFTPFQPQHAFGSEEGEGSPAAAAPVEDSSTSSSSSATTSDSNSSEVESTSDEEEMRRRHLERREVRETRRRAAREARASHRRWREEEAKRQRELKEEEEAAAAAAAAEEEHQKRRRQHRHSQHPHTRRHRRLQQKRTHPHADARAFVDDGLFAIDPNGHDDDDGTNASIFGSLDGFTYHHNQQQDGGNRNGSRNYGSTASAEAAASIAASAVAAAAAQHQQRLARALAAVQRKDATIAALRTALEAARETAKARKEKGRRALEKLSRAAQKSDAAALEAAEQRRRAALAAFSADGAISASRRLCAAMADEAAFYYNEAVEQRFRLIAAEEHLRFERGTDGAHPYRALLLAAPAAGTSLGGSAGSARSGGGGGGGGGSEVGITRARSGSMGSAVLLAAPAGPTDTIYHGKTTPSNTNSNNTQLPHPPLQQQQHLAADTKAVLATSVVTCSGGEGGGGGQSIYDLGASVATAAPPQAPMALPTAAAAPAASQPATTAASVGGGGGVLAAVGVVGASALLLGSIASVSDGGLSARSTAPFVPTVLPSAAGTTAEKGEKDEKRPSAAAIVGKPPTTPPPSAHSVTTPRPLGTTAAAVVTSVAATAAVAELISSDDRPSSPPPQPLVMREATAFFGAAGGGGGGGGGVGGTAPSSAPSSGPRGGTGTTDTSSFAASSNSANISVVLTAAVASAADGAEAEGKQKLAMRSAVAAAVTPAPSSVAGTSPTAFSATASASGGGGKAATDGSDEAKDTSKIMARSVSTALTSGESPPLNAAPPTPYVNPTAKAIAEALRGLLLPASEGIDGGYGIAGPNRNVGGGGRRNSTLAALLSTAPHAAHTYSDPFGDSIEADANALLAAAAAGGSGGLPRHPPSTTSAASLPTAATPMPSINKDADGGDVLVPVPASQLLRLVGVVEAHAALRAEFRLLEATHAELGVSMRGLHKRLFAAEDTVAAQRKALEVAGIASSLASASVPAVSPTLASLPQAPAITLTAVPPPAASIAPPPPPPPSVSFRLGFDGGDKEGDVAQSPIPSRGADAYSVDRGSYDVAPQRSNADHHDDLLIAAQQSAADHNVATKWRAESLSGAVSTPRGKDGDSSPAPILGSSTTGAAVSRGDHTSALYVPTLAAAAEEDENGFNLLSAAAPNTKQQGGQYSYNPDVPRSALVDRRRATHARPNAVHATNSNTTNSSAHHHYMRGTLTASPPPPPAPQTLPHYNTAALASTNINVGDGGGGLGSLLGRPSAFDAAWASIRNRSAAAANATSAVGGAGGSVFLNGSTRLYSAAADPSPGASAARNLERQLSPPRHHRHHGAAAHLDGAVAGLSPSSKVAPQHSAGGGGGGYNTFPAAQVPAAEHGGYHSSYDFATPPNSAAAAYFSDYQTAPAAANSPPPPVLHTAAFRGGGGTCIGTTAEPRSGYPSPPRQRGTAAIGANTRWTPPRSPI